MDVKALSTAIARYLPEDAALALLMQRLQLPEGAARQVLHDGVFTDLRIRIAPSTSYESLSVERADVLALIALIEAARSAAACPSTASAALPSDADLDRWLEGYTGKRTKDAIEKALPADFPA